MIRYTFVVRDLHPLLLADLPAHPFRHLPSGSGCFRLERLQGGVYTH
jgi:hypothetical protein